MDYLNKLKDEMNYQNITQKELSDKTGISINTIRGWFSKKVYPDLESAYKIAQLLNQPLEYFINGDIFTPNNYHLPTREIKLLEKYRTLPEQEKNAIDKMIESLAKDKTDQIEWNKTINVEFNIDNSAPEDLKEVVNQLSKLTASEREPIIDIIQNQVTYWIKKR